ncbi:hypothetical protein BSFA1_31440 [Burkholderia sp. SFA1]|uniref:hypothetical protein n=1 Tax=unclassified Caballeronia TaxID=2646786 RepID=UPI001F21A90B|nr:MULTISPECIES: hypothetical protein [unclassified Caballeronia]MCE4545101.1 hypothetical protein [Caballeronia sp. PC1]MCE4570526.1 hypothetical protein [Caballeronia sp. CLC5]BBP98015.1 hypothetical protein BSFA1_31440 [Burkholderia sp. SFA1]
MKRLIVLWKIVKNDGRVLWRALRRPDRPRWLLPATVLLALYALAPFNIAVPLMGIVDDGVLVPLLLHLIVQCLPMRFRVGRTG